MGPLFSISGSQLTFKCVECSVCVEPIHDIILFEYIHNNFQCIFVSSEGHGSICCLFPQVNGTEIEYEFEEITLERVSISYIPQLYLTSENLWEHSSARWYSEMVSWRLYITFKMVINIPAASWEGLHSHTVCGFVYMKWASI